MYMAQYCKIQDLNDERMVDYRLLHKTVYFLSYVCICYTTSRSTLMNICVILPKIKNIIHVDGSNSPYVYAIGDHNADITRNATFSTELNTWCTTHSLEMVDREGLPSDTYT